MSVTDDALKAKFSTLNETQDSIVSVSNWMMFHRYATPRLCHQEILNIAIGDMQTALFKHGITDYEMSEHQNA